MQTGVLNQDSFSQVLRSLSQRRRQGALEIHLPEEQVELNFVQGKIVDVVVAGQNPVEQLFNQLQSAGWIGSEFECEAESYAELFLFLNESRSGEAFISEELFRRVLNHKVLDALYRLPMDSGAYFAFRTRMIECEKELLPSVSVGQLLLDLVALETDGERFQEAFPEEGVIVSVPETDLALSEEEKAIFDCCHQGLNLSELRDKTFLSKFHIQDSLLAMLERGLVEVRSAGEVVVQQQQQPAEEGRPLSSEAVKVDAFLDSLENSIDSVFDEEFGDLGEAEQVIESAAQGSVDSGVYAEEGSQVVPDDLALRSPLQIKLTMMNMKLQQDPRIIHLAVVVFALAGLVAPFLFWGEMIVGFGEGRF